MKVSVKECIGKRVLVKIWRGNQPMPAGNVMRGDWGYPESITILDISPSSRWVEIKRGGSSEWTRRGSIKIIEVLG